MNSHQRAIEKAARARLSGSTATPTGENQGKPEESKKFHDDPTFLAEARSKKRKLTWGFLFWLGSAISGLILTSGFAHLVPGPKVEGHIMYRDTLPDGDRICPRYDVIIGSPETLDYLHFEIQFPERVGDYRLNAVTFKNAGVIGKVAPGLRATAPITVSAACQFIESQNPLPNNVGPAFYAEPASKIVVNAGDVSSLIFGTFTVPSPSGKDPNAGIDAVVEYRYTKFGFSVRKRTALQVEDPRKFKFMGDRAIQ